MRGQPGTEADDAPLIGRAEERAVLRAAMQQAVSVVVRGDAGIGKSTLVRAGLEGRTSDRVVRGVAVLGAVPYSPLRVAFPDLDVTCSPVEGAELIARRVPSNAYLVVDDLQWCDADTLAVLAEFAMRGSMIVTVRSDA